MSKLSEIVKVFRNCQSCQKLSHLSENLKVIKLVRNCQSCQKLSKLSEIVKVVKNGQNCQKLSKLSEIVKIVFWLVRPHHHSDQIRQKVKVPVPGGYLAVPGGYLTVPGGYLNTGVLLSCSGQLKKKNVAFLDTFEKSTEMGETTALLFLGPLSG